MEEELKKNLLKDKMGLQTYEYIANNIGRCDEIIPELVEIMKDVDPQGQITVSTALFLHSIDAEKYAKEIDVLIKMAIDKDRERKYIADLLPEMWGKDYAEHVAELNASDDNFRRIYKRVYPQENKF